MSGSSNNSRRKLLKSIAAGSGAVVAGRTLPDSWSRPVVDSIVLPAHAQTSARIYGGLQVTDNESERNMFAEALDLVLPTAQADIPIGGPPYICISVIGFIASLAVMGPAYNMIRRGTIKLDENMTGFGQIVATPPNDVSQKGQCPDMVVKCGSQCLARPAKLDASEDDKVVFGMLTQFKGWMYVTVNRTDSCGPEPAFTGMCY